MSELVLELGLEELPASFVRSALDSLRAAVQEWMSAERMPGEVTVFGTPRRVGIRVTGIQAKQEDRDDVITGPAWNIAFKDGNPTPAALGFAKKNGVLPADLFEEKTDKGSYVAARVRTQGKSAREAWSAALPDLCRRITFPKTMRWGDGELAFGRPVHWIVALLDADVIDFEFARVRSGRVSRGHRFLGRSAVTIERASDFLDALRREHVIAALDERAALMRQLLEQAATEAQGTLYADEFLLDECLMLIEKPFVVPGTIDPEFLELPEDVIISVMRDHQRYFAVHGADGRLLGRYLNVVGTAEEPKAIAKGNDRVLRARLKDAAFFVSEDRKVTLASRRSKLDAITFQHKLGSIGAKVERIRNIAAHVSSEVEPALLERAAMLCKADLESHIVFEFPELQGKMGRFYAAKDGEDERVCRAIEEHWRPAGAKDELPSEAIGASLAIADRIDTLAGCFAIGLVPKGNADPFALRRASVGLLRLAADGPVDVAFRSLIDVAFGELVRAGVIADSDIASARDQLLEFFGARARAFFRERGVATDLVEAAIGAWLCEPEGSLVRLEGRMRAVEALAASPAYDSLAVAFKRAFNIASSSTGSFEISKTESGAERALADAYLGIEEELHRLRAEGKFSEALSLIASRLRAPIDTFFEQVFVMAEDETIRQNRLALLGRIAGAVQSIIHFHVLAPRSTNATSE